MACEDEARYVEYAASLDLDFDAISHAVTLSATWSPDSDAETRDGESRPGSGITDRPVIKYRENHRIEVGVLQSEKADEVEELSLGGYLAVLGEDDKPSTSSEAVHCALCSDANSASKVLQFSPSPPATTRSQQPSPLKTSPRPSSTRPACTQS